MKCVNEKGKEIHPLSMVKTHDGETWLYIGFREPRSLASTGRVILQDLTDPKVVMEYYPGVINARIVHDDAVIS